MMGTKKFFVSGIFIVLLSLPNLMGARAEQVLPPEVGSIRLETKFWDLEIGQLPKAVAYFLNVKTNQIQTNFVDWQGLELGFNEEITCEGNLVRVEMRAPGIVFIEMLEPPEEGYHILWAPRAEMRDGEWGLRVYYGIVVQVGNQNPYSKRWRNPTIKFPLPVEASSPERPHVSRWFRNGEVEFEPGKRTLVKVGNQRYLIDLTNVVKMGE